MESEELVIPSATWLQEWDRTVDPRRLRSYVKTELERLHAQGEPLLHLVALLPLPQQKDLALSVLAEMGYRPRLRLRPGASPPLTDSEGRALPANLRGKVLRAKVDYNGNDSSLKNDPIAAAAFSGPSRAHLARTQGLYRYVDVGQHPDSFSIAEGITVLTHWGVGVRGKRFRKRGAMDTWLVEEVVPPPQEQPAPSKRQAPRSRQEAQAQASL